MDFVPWKCDNLYWRVCSGTFSVWFIFSVKKYCWYLHWCEALFLHPAVLVYWQHLGKHIFAVGSLGLDFYIHYRGCLYTCTCLAFLSSSAILPILLDHHGFHVFAAMLLAAFFFGEIVLLGLLGSTLASATNNMSIINFQNVTLKITLCAMLNETTLNRTMLHWNSAWKIGSCNTTLKCDHTQ